MTGGSESFPELRRAPQAHIGYRPDIDGLRAIAVLAVIGFHATPRFVPGGFVGVDVFFVISGYLISAIIFKQLERDRFSFVDFYARRIRRIFPALIVTLIGVVAIGWYVLTGAEFRQLQKHVAAGALYVSNFALWGEAGYFDARSEVKPLLHLWSLAIEEQFYIVWPPLLYLCWKRGLNVLSVILVIVCASFAINAAHVGVNAAGAFYLPAGRVWELLLGGLLAYVDTFRREPVDRLVRRMVFSSPRLDGDRLIADAKAAIGLALIAIAAAFLSKSLLYPGWWFGSRTLRDVASVFRLDQGNLYPGWWALLPTLGTALLIWAGPDAWINRAFLARRPLVYIGLMSYPLYLWHWPLLSFVEITENGHPSRVVKLTAVAVSAVLAWLTYELVEKPARRTMSVRTVYRILAVASSLVLIGAVSLYGFATGGWPSRTPHFPTDAVLPSESPRHDSRCTARFPVDSEYCRQYTDTLPVATALIGDSHAEHFFAGLGEALKRRGENLVHLGQSGCPPLLDIVKTFPRQADNCRAANGSVIDVLVRDRAITRVVLSFRGAYDVAGVGVGPSEPLEPALFRIAGTSLSPDSSISQALTRTVETLQRSGKTVWLIEQVPELDFDVAECIGRPFSFQNRVRVPCAVSKADVVARQAPYRRIVEAVSAALPALEVFDPMPYLCDDAMCYAFRNGTLLYMDNNHLSREGSLSFADRFRFD